MNRIFADLPNTIFDVMSQAARDLNAINLGQGFPDDPGPLDVRQKAADAVLNGYNQYPSMMGIPELRQAIATHYAHWHGLQLDAMSEVMVTSGGTEALTGSILGLVEPGDFLPSHAREVAGHHYAATSAAARSALAILPVGVIGNASTGRISSSVRL